jgi:hypothetical protein
MVGEEVPRVTGIAAAGEPDGSHVIEITEPNGTKRRVMVPTEVVAPLARLLQIDILERASRSAQKMELPMMVVRSVNVAHRGRESDLVFSTEQVGSVILQMSDTVLRQLQYEIQRVQTYRSTSLRAH